MISFSLAGGISWRIGGFGIFTSSFGVEMIGVFVVLSFVGVLSGNGGEYHPPVLPQ